MEDTKEIRRVDPTSWILTLGSSLPLWLLSLSITGEGFPRPPISIEVAIIAFLSAILVSIVLLWRGWMTAELLIFSFLPLLMTYNFDEISTAYKTPFIIACASILVAGLVGYQRVPGSRLWRWLILLVAATLFLFAVWHASNGFWDMTRELGYVRCFPDAPGCTPLKELDATPWWILFFVP